MDELLLYVSANFLIVSSFVGFIYAFDNRMKCESHPDSIKKRFLAVFCNNVFSITLTYFLLKQNYNKPFYEMGFRLTGLINAIIFPSLLTLCIYFESLISMLKDGTFASLFSLNYWNEKCDIEWFKFVFVGPISEEIAFRACSGVLINHYFGWNVAVFMSSFFFAISHFHHIFEDLENNLSLSESIIFRTYQLIYTYLFGIYASFLFFQTKHIIAPIITHSICNVFGLPSLFNFCWISSPSRQILFLILNLVGFTLWVSLLTRFTAVDLFF